MLYLYNFLIGNFEMMVSVNTERYSLLFGDLFEKFYEIEERLYSLNWKV